MREPDHPLASRIDREALGGAPIGRGADIIVSCLIRAGVDILFGLPGDTGVVLYDALHARADRIRHVLTRDERHAASMGDAYARVTGRVGVVEVSSGGGSTYVVGGLGEPFASGVPMLVISSDIHSASRDTGALTEIDQLALFSAVTKWRAIARSAAEIPALVSEGITAATSGRPGPVALIVPEDVLDEKVELQLPPELEGAAAQVPHARPGADAQGVSAAASLLVEASRPAIVVGSGIHTSAAWAQLSELAELCGVPVATTIHGKGAITEHDPWNLGVVGNNGGRDYSNHYLSSADVVMFIGTRANATDTNSYTTPPREGTQTIHLDISPERAGKNYPDSVRLVGDARTTLTAVTERIVELGPSSDRAESIARWLRSEAEAWRENVDAERPLLPAGKLLPRDIIETVATTVGRDIVLLGDPGTPTPNIASYWSCSAPGRSVLLPRGHGPMGWAIPAAVGASLAAPGRSVVAITADGSFAMAAGELETVARLKLPICYIQFTNDSLGWIKMLQHLYTGQRYFGVDPGPIDAVGVARAAGLQASRAATIHDLRALLDAFAESPAPLYIDVDVPHMIDHLPPVPFWRDAVENGAERPTY